MSALLQRLPAREFALGLSQGCFGPLQFRLAAFYVALRDSDIRLVLQHARLESPRVDARDDFARLHGVIEVRMQFSQLSRELGADHDGIQRGQGPGGEDDAFDVAHLYGAQPIVDLLSRR